MKKIKIQNKFISDGEPIFIIAEAGVNHNGKLSLAKKLVDVAKDAGCDAVKFQTFKTEGVMTKYAQKADYQKKITGGEETQYEMAKKLELKYKDFIELKKYCDEKEIMFLSAPHSEDAIDFLENLVPAYKFGSGDLTNIPALEYAAKKGKPMIIGTGMGTMDEIKEALNAIYNQGNKDVVLLHCTTNYPCPLKEVNLRAMQKMQKELDCLVGLIVMHGPQVQPHHPEQQGCTNNEQEQPVIGRFFTQRILFIADNADTVVCSDIYNLIFHSDITHIITG